MACTTGQTNPDGDVTYEHVTCLGMCELAPVALNGTQPVAHLTPDDVPAFLEGTLPSAQGLAYGEPRHILARVGNVDPTSLDDYQTHGGYTGLAKALAMTPEQVIELAEKTGVVGRGGAMFPTGRKWRFTRGTPVAPAQKHIVVNADESEPGTFKDRYLLEDDPFSLIEATTSGWLCRRRGKWLDFCARRIPPRLCPAQRSGREGPSGRVPGAQRVGASPFPF
ncbi:MAG: NAD(P)H-dependent oxidoreductase subunit E [Candidatus Promineifilaceae bacterium]